LRNIKQTDSIMQIISCSKIERRYISSNNEIGYSFGACLSRVTHILKLLFDFMPFITSHKHHLTYSPIMLHNISI